MKLLISQYTSFLFFLLAVAMLLSACSNNEPNETPAPSDDRSEIRVKADVSTMTEGTRATLFATGALTSGSFTCAVYNANTTTTFISPTAVNWVTDHWEFSDGKHFWPSSGSLDFFAYIMPSPAPSYITSSLAYSTPRSAQFTCANLPMTFSSDNATAGQGSDLQEFVYALATDQNKAGQGTSGVTLNFKHPFARIKFQLSANHPDIKINSITFEGLKTGGICTFDGTNSTWTNLTPADGTVDFVVTLKGDAVNFNTHATSTPTPIGVDYLMIPQTFAGNITVNATWTDWGEEFAHNVSTTLPPITWQAGNNYTYTFTITEYDLRVDTSKYTEQW